MGICSIDPIGSGTVEESLRTLDKSWTYGGFNFSFQGFIFDLTATPIDDNIWEFDNFSWTVDARSQRGEPWYHGDNKIYDNPTPSDFESTGSAINKIIFYGHETSNRDKNTYTYNPSNITAHFKKKKYHVSISSNPTNGGLTNGGGDYEYDDTCTLTANRNEGYELMSLEEGGGTVLVPQNPPQCFGKTITHSFNVTGSSSWVANFRECTNVILRGHSGNILHGSGGNILRDY